MNLIYCLLMINYIFRVLNYIVIMKEYYIHIFKKKLIFQSFIVLEDNC